MIKNYEYILFDLDGTITDPKEGITKSIQYSLRHFGIEIENLDELCPFIGPPLGDSFMNYFNFNKEKSLLAIEKYRKYFSVKGIFENVVYPGISELLQTLVNENKKCILATSKPAVYAIKILSHFDLNKYFIFVSGSELDGRRTKKSEVIEYALCQNNITELSSVIMVGDREHDIIGAKQIGLDSVGVLYGYGSRQELLNAGANYIAADISQLQAIIL